MSFVTDTFTDTNGTSLASHVPDSGGTIGVNGAFSSSAAIINASDRARASVTGFSLFYYSATPPTPDYDVQSDVFTASNSGAVGIMGRMSQSAQTYYLLDYESSGNVNLYAVVAGATKQQVQHATTFSASSTHTLKLTLRGSTITGFLDGSQVVQFTDANITSAGNAGILFNATSSPSDALSFQVDNFSATATISFALSPAAVYVSSAQTITVTGSNTAWTSGTTFSATAGTISGLSINVGAQTATFTYTAPGTPQTVTISDSTDAATATITTSTPVLIPVNDANLFPSPYNWIVTGGTSMKTNNPGAYIKLGVTGTTALSVNIDVSGNSTESAGNYPKIAWRVDDGVWQSHQLASSDANISLAAGLASGSTHALEFIVQGAWWQDDRWTTPVSAVKITSFEVDAGGSSVAPATYPGRMILFWDSNGEGYELLGIPVSEATQDAVQTASLLLARAFQCEVGVVAFAGQGYTAAGGGNVPILPSAWNLYWSGQSRLTAGLLNPAPNYIFCLHGENDSVASDSSVTSAVTAIIASFRAAAPSAWILIGSPANLVKASAIQAGVAAAVDSKALWVTTGENLLSGGQGLGTYHNEVHLNSRGHARYAAAIARAAQQYIGVFGVTSGSGGGISVG